ncbi:stationary-phase survival protein SurE [Phenylobacterium zucineum HLK1]|uniref:5'-nucleotidase SurE n=1 Tax=Phenylobacterium zucineum (strain HLK1) TaxID=450851 RepID=SURE_PHEZH|nr:5'/3'-nucleotidase SurE [Phenylobacterium zucineum]B4RDI0.1 RecName: Full=5'-nucleotidase SurE; AltName: Full=Nucleoside 5'-monophosphate phosphohydrolase [Phenylobacterium zucineum HLK1]ACG78370.1 stationary-phase survival protein SurE [Phenylobacterium zucineum HLK1]
MRILITNDDGINADGLAALERIAAQLSDDVWVCAPEYEQSGASRALTLAEPIRVRRLDDRKFSTTGTPTDCVMLAVHELVKGRRPDLLLSGVNRGANLAEDVSMSGTVAGAIEGMALGVPSIALSQMGFYEPGESFEPAEAFAPGIIKRLVELGWPADVVLNVNFPNRPVEEITEVEVTRQGFRDVHVRHAERRTDLRGKEYYWIGFRQERSSPPDGTDLRALYEGKISVTPLHIDLTHQPAVFDLKGKLGGAPPKV